MRDRDGIVDSQNLQHSEVPPETFVKQVKDALQHIYDLGYLQRHPLAQELCTETSTEMVGQRLRRALVSAIDALNPGQDIPFRAPEARLHSALTLHYMERMTIQGTARELAVSLRQALRNLRQGEKSVAVVLWGRRSAFPREESNAVQLSSLQEELAHLEVQSYSTDLCLLLERARETVEPQAVQRNVTFQVEVPTEPVILSTNQVVARQVLVSALSHAAGQAQPGALYVVLSAGEEEGRVCLTLRYDAQPNSDGPAVSPTAVELAKQIGWTVRQEDESGSTRTVVLCMTARRPTVLIIDDNAGLVNLLQRYLSDRACRVMAAANGLEGLALAHKIRPDAIVLDIMMPEMDGWEVLQRLRNDPQTTHIPVIICTVVAEPDLAQALKASHFLPKPVRQVEVLDALRQLGVV
jgi:CheY-like chemotaxis protein